MKHIVYAILGLVVLAGSLTWSFLAVWKQFQLKSWPSTNATIVSFDPGVDPQSEGHWYANPKILFRYTVSGVAYESTGVNPSPLNYQSENAFKADTARFIPGASVPCWYNPSLPPESFVVNGGVTTGSILVTLVSGSVGLFLLALTVTQIYWEVAKSRECLRASEDN